MSATLVLCDVCYWDKVEGEVCIWCDTLCYCSGCYKRHDPKDCPHRVR